MQILAPQLKAMTSTWCYSFSLRGISNVVQNLWETEIYLQRFTNHNNFLRFANNIELLLCSVCLPDCLSSTNSHKCATQSVYMCTYHCRTKLSRIVSEDILYRIVSILCCGWLDILIIFLLKVYRTRKTGLAEKLIRNRHPPAKTRGKGVMIYILYT